MDEGHRPPDRPSKPSLSGAPARTERAAPEGRGKRSPAAGRPGRERPVCLLPRRLSAPQEGPGSDLLEVLQNELDLVAVLGLVSDQILQAYLEPGLAERFGLLYPLPVTLDRLLLRL